jgi:urea carboxylase
VANPAGAAGLECTVRGPTLRFNRAALICLAGAHMHAELDGAALPYWTPLEVSAGATLTLGAIDGGGLRTYLAIQGGTEVPDYLGSRSTFTLGRFGGHAGRTLKHGDVLHLPPAPQAAHEPASVPHALRPHYPRAWTLGVLYGPHGAPDFFTDADIGMLFASEWRVHFNSSRTGVRLIGPKPQWARPDGGEAGLHPSNIHDNAYAIGTIDFTGDMPILLGPDGPSLGGFVCPATVVQAELWKLGQLAPGDTVRFALLSESDAAQRLQAYETAIAGGAAADAPWLHALDVSAEQLRRVGDGAALAPLPAATDRPAVVYRPQGDHYLLVEYGPLVLDLTLRFRVHALMQWLQGAALPGVIDLTPGIRSLQIHYDSRVLSRRDLLAQLAVAETRLPPVDAMQVPTRVVRLPLSWDDDATQLAIRKYMQGVRKDAPWCPSNIEFIRRINGLDDVEAVRQIVFAARYLVLGLGDVYLGAPVATPIDPRHRLVTTKYNPARTWTPENAVGIGGAYLCVYGMEGPGGYQFVGRTLQMWNRFHETADFPPGQPWLLRFFDQLQFYPVSAEDLLRLREDFIQGRMRLETHDEVFRLHDYREFLRANAPSIDAFRARQQAAFAAERERWAALPAFDASSDDTAGAEAAVELPAGCAFEAAAVPGSVWKIAVAVGDQVAAGDVLVILESMKMEIPVLATAAGEVQEVLCAEGRAVAAGDPLCVLRLSDDVAAARDASGHG